MSREEKGKKKSKLGKHRDTTHTHNRHPPYPTASTDTPPPQSEAEADATSRTHRRRKERLEMVASSPKSGGPKSSGPKSGGPKSGGPKSGGSAGAAAAAADGPSPVAVTSSGGADPALSANPQQPGKKTGGIDAHPFSRQSVIEVIHYGSKPTAPRTPANPNGFGYAEDDRTDSSDGGGFWSSDDEDADAALAAKAAASDPGEKDDDEDKDGDGEGKANLPEGTSVLLCDVIDRVSSSTPNHPLPERRWKYYIHYRDYNRRMDEWISSDRIVSPPSVGGSKIRAMKKEEERRRREEREREVADKRRREEEELERARKRLAEQAAAATLAAQEGSAGGGDGGAPPSQRPRLSRRQSRRPSLSGQDGDGDGTAGDGDGNEPSRAVSPAGGGGQQRLTRRQKRTVTGADGATADGSASGAASPMPGASAAHGGTGLVAEERVEQNVVTTIAATTLDEHEGLDEASLKEHEEVTKVKNVSSIELGQYRMETWYFSPFPKELLASCGGIIDILYVCDFTLSFFTRKDELIRFQEKELPKNRRHPPGNEIYRCGNLSMFEVDGLHERIYCQNLCYIAKMFIDHKTLFFDVDPFLFYVLCERDDRGFHPVGYYSKEKYSDVGYNLACILTFPAHQRKGYGRFIIAFSYELSKKEEKVGSPEKPISDMGQKAYLPYWTSTVVDFFLHHSDDSQLSVMDISKRTSIFAEDIIFALNQIGILKFINGVYFVSADRKQLLELAKKHPVKEPRVDPSRLHWTPYITDVKRDKFSIHSKKPSVQQAFELKEAGEQKKTGGGGYHR